MLGTTDLHGNVLNWDYFTDAEFDDADHNDVGLAKISTMVKEIREERGHRNTLLIDAGDTIQGTQLSYYYAKVDPITERRGPVHPMARAMNAIGYDAAALGNHEFNYGIEVLRKFEEQCRFPLLGANALDAKSLRPAFAPYVIKRMRTPFGRDVRVAVLGLTNPGVAIWDKVNVQGRMVFPGLVEQAAKWVPKLRSMGADVVLVSAHSGTSGTSSWGDQLPYVENAAARVAEEVPGIDAILVGHAHQEIAEYVVENKESGRPVVLSEPLKWGQRLTLFDIEVVWERGRWVVERVASEVRNSNTAEEDPGIVRLLAGEHKKVVAYVNQVIGTSVEEMSAAEGPVKDVPIIDLINHVQTETVRAGLAGGAYAELPVVSQASCFSRTARMPAGEVTIKDAAGLYPFEHAGGAGADGRAAQGVSGVLGAVLRADGAGGSGRSGGADQRGRNSGLQLRRVVRGDVRGGCGAAGGVADRGAQLRGGAGGGGRAVRSGGEQLPGEWGRGVPARGVGGAGVGGPGGDPEHDHRVGAGDGDGGPGPVRVGGVAADAGG